MTTFPPSSPRWIERVSSALADLASGVQSLGPDCWSLTLPETALPPVRVRLAGSYLRLATELGDRAPEQAWPLVMANGSLSGLAKFALTRDQHVALQAELPLGEGVDLPLRLRQTLAGLGAAVEIFRYGAARAVSVTPPEPESGPDLDLKHLCQETGWPFMERAVNRFTVPLEINAGSRSAILTRRGAEVALTAELAMWDSLGPRSRSALAILLLAASGFVRLGRAVVVEDSSGCAARLEVVFASHPCVAELTSACCCLTAGVNLCAAQVEALADETAAEDFLTVRAGACTTALENPTRKEK